MVKLVAVSDKGRVVGESHPKSKLTDHEVDLIRHLHETARLSYKILGDKFEVSKGAIAKIVKCERRAVVAVRVKRVPITRR